MAEKTIEDAEREAKRIIKRWTAGAALTGWVPGSSFFLTAADLAMIYQVARAFEVKDFDTENVTFIARQALVGGGTAKVVAEAIGFIPIAGWAAKSATMAAKAHLVGYSVINYFRVRSKLPRSKEDPPKDKPAITISVDQ